MITISNAIWDLLVRKNAFGLVPKEMLKFNLGYDDWEQWKAGRLGLEAGVYSFSESFFVNNADYRFLTDEAKVEAFRRWLQDQIDQGLLQVIGGIKSKPWTAKFVESAYRKGILRSYSDTHKAGMAESQDFYQGSKEQFLKDVFSQPEMMSKIALLGTRAFEGMRGMSSQMSADLSRILADGMANGYGAVKIAREMRKSIEDLSSYRALLISRTEIIHAHAEGQLDSLQFMGVKEVTAEVEWLTARDSAVCRKCSHMEGQVFTIEEARGMIPLHPACRCCWKPKV